MNIYLINIDIDYLDFQWLNKANQKTDKKRRMLPMALTVQGPSRTKFSTLATSLSSFVRGLKLKVELGSSRIASKSTMMIERSPWTRKSHYQKDILSTSLRSTSKSIASESSSM